LGGRITLGKKVGVGARGEKKTHKEAKEKLNRGVEKQRRRKKGKKKKKPKKSEMGNERKIGQRATRGEIIT